MLGCAHPGWKVMISESLRDTRQLKHTLELVHNGTCWIGVNPSLANAIAEEGIRSGMIPGPEKLPYRPMLFAPGQSSRFDRRAMPARDMATKAPRNAKTTEPPNPDRVPAASGSR
jgi:DNA-binding sugar fermentation-stimulating protein